MQDALPLGLHQVLPTQLPRRHRGVGGPPAFFAALLANALEDAGLGPRRPPPPRTSARYARLADRLAASRRALAVAWLCGQLEREVVVPLEVACTALGIDAAALAAVVRRLGSP
jgi:hypothetical protein